MCVVFKACDTLVIGGGPAGLASSRELTRAGVSHVVLERGAQAGETWATLYDSLVLHTARRLSALPGLDYPAGTALYPSRQDFLSYLHRFQDTFRVPLETGADVTTLRRHRDEWVARTAAGSEFHARSVIVATGIASSPVTPAIPHRQEFRGRVMHSRDYLRPDGFKGQRVLVVGAGNSAGEIAVDLAGGGADVTVSVRTGANVIPRDILGIPAQYFAVAVATLPRSAQRAVLQGMAAVSGMVRGRPVIPPAPRKECSQVPLIGFHLLDAIRSGAIQLKKGLTSFTPDGVTFADDSSLSVDVVILATGYQAALGFLNGDVRRDACGFGRRIDAVTSADQPNLYYVGHNYDLRGGIFNIGKDARRAAKNISTAFKNS
jgi:putative flavoprotein involved in K+ transport